MIVKNHTIELKDTSASEMARFRQIMLGIWSQQIEDDKNAVVMESTFNNFQTNNTLNLISIRRVAQSIKKHLGKAYKPMLFNDLIEEDLYPLNNPINSENLTYTDSQGAQKSGVILLKWIPFTGLNLKPETFKASIEIGNEQTDFSLTIFQEDLKETAFRFTMHDFDLFIALFVELGIAYTDIGNQAIIDLYRKKIKEANDDPNKLDVIYQSFPKILFGKWDDKELYKHLDIILNDMYQFGGSAGTNEDKAILQILYAINDRQALYTILRDMDNGILFTIYQKLQGEEVQDLLRFLTRLVEEFDKSKPTSTTYFDNSYYLFRDTHVKTEWSDGTILLNNYKDATKMTVTKEYKNLMETYAPEYYIKNKSFNPLAKLNFGTKLGDLGEQVGDENTFVIALKLHDMAIKQSNWDLFNIATDLLSLLSAYGALRVVLAKGASIAMRTLAGLTLAKDAAHYTMLSDGTLEKWHANGYGWLANLWVLFSITVDLASFGLPNLSKIAKEGNAAAELAETAEEASEIRRVANEANRIIEAETGKDVSKMSDKQFEKFVKKAEKKQNADPEQYGEFIDTPENIQGKIKPNRGVEERRASRRKEISEETEVGKWKDKDHGDKKNFSNDELETFVEIELIHQTKVRPSITGEAGDVVGLTGKWAGKTFDAAGLPNNPGAIKGWEHKFVRNLRLFKESIDDHFDKLKRNPPLDKFVLDLRHVDKYPPQTKEEILNYLEENYKSYLNNSDKFEIVF